MEPIPNNQKNVLSNNIKIPIIILTLITLCAMGILFVKIALSVNSSEKNNAHQFLISVGDKLKNNGLNEQAIEQYIKYLDKTKPGTLFRSTVAHTVGELYMKLNNCREALTWLFLAEIEDPTYQRANELKEHINICLSQIRSSEPKNLTTM